MCSNGYYLLALLAADFFFVQAADQQLACPPRPPPLTFNTPIITHTHPYYTTCLRLGRQCHIVSPMGTAKAAASLLGWQTKWRLK